MKHTKSLDPKDIGTSVGCIEYGNIIYEMMLQADRTVLFGDHNTNGEYLTLSEYIMGVPNKYLPEILEELAITYKTL